MSEILEKQGYKYTEEFGYIPEDWEIKNIVKTSNLKARIGWQGLTTAEYLNNGDYLLVTGTDFDNGKINWQSCFYVEKKRYDQDTNIQLKNGDVLITKDGTIGKVAYIDSLPKPTTLNSGVFVVKPLNEAYNTKYFYYMLQSNIFISFLNKLKAGSTIVHLYQKDLSNFDYIIPSDVKEQEKIAEVLGDIDSLIDKTQQLINKKKDLKTATMQKLLTPKEGWITKTLEELNIEMLKGNGLSKEQLSDAGKYYCIHYGELFTFYKECIKNIKHKTNIATVFSKINDVLMPSSDVTPTGLAKASCIKSDNVVLGGDILILRCKKVIDGTFLSYLIRRDKNQILQLVSGTTVYHIYPNDMKKFKISYPKNISEQEKIATILSDMDSEIEALEKELNKYKDLKTGMMQQLLTGKVRLI